MKIRKEWLERLDDLSKLENNWGYDGEKEITPMAVHTCKVLLYTVIPHHVRTKDVFISPDPEGGLEIWCSIRMENDVCFEIGPDGSSVKWQYPDDEE